MRGNDDWLDALAQQLPKSLNGPSQPRIPRGHTFCSSVQAGVMITD